MTEVPNKAWSLDRPTILGGTAGFVTALAAYGLKAFFGIELDPTLTGLLSVGVGYLITWFVPPSVQDIIKHVDDAMIEAARKSVDSPASPK